MNSASSRFRLLVALLALAPACAAYQASEFSNELASLRKHLPPEMVWMDDWDAEPWKEGFNTAQLNRDIVEYVQPPETVNDWTELLTMIVEWRTSKPYTYDGGQTFAAVPDPLDVMEATKRTAQEGCATPVVFRKLDEDRTGAYPSVTFYLACGECAGSTTSRPGAEADVYRVFQGQHGLHMLIRARRAAELDEATLIEWTKYLNRFYVCDDTVPGHPCGKK